MSFSRQVQPIFTANCAFPACHTGPAAQRGLNLTTAATSYAGLVNRPSAECPSVVRADPGFPDSSYVIWKLEGAGACFGGSRMPLGGGLALSDIETIRRWILQGALNN